MRPMRFVTGGRHSQRLPGHNYASSAIYFVTICTYERICWFGDIVDGRLVPTRAGEIVEAAWRTTLQRFGQVSLDSFVVMPNHVHGLIRIGPGAGTEPLGAMIRAFKGASTHMIRASGDASFGWHRNYHDHVVRDAASLERIRQYILTNPRSWENDIYHPTREGL